MSKLNRTLSEFLAHKEFVVSSTLGNLPVGTTVKIVGTYESKQEVKLQVIDLKGEDKKLPISTKGQLDILSKIRPGTTHTVKIYDALSRLSAPTEQHDLKINLTSMKGVDFEAKDLKEPHIVLGAKSTIKVQGFICLHTKELTGMIILRDQVRNGVPFCVAFVDFDTYEDAAFEMIDNTVEDKELYQMIKPFTMPGQFTHYATKDGDTVIGIDLRSRFSIPEYEGVNFFRLQIPWYSLKKRTTSKDIRTILQSIRQESGTSTHAILSDSDY